jgi:hypothetical protein
MRLFQCISDEFVQWTRQPLLVPRRIWEIRPHEQRCRPLPPGGESAGGIIVHFGFIKGICSVFKRTHADNVGLLST